jgi:hypothetical protein
VTTTFTPAEILARLEATWDMPTLTADPDVLDWLMERYFVDFDMVGQVVVAHRSNGRVVRFDTADVRSALRRTLLEAVTTP